MTTSTKPSASRRAVTSVPVRPCGLSDTRRNPVVLASADAGRSNARTTSPAVRAVVRTPGDEVGDGQATLPAVRRPDDRGRVEGHQQRRDRPRGQRGHHVPAHGRRVPHLERREQGVRAPVDERPGTPSWLGVEPQQRRDRARRAEAQSVGVRSASGQPRPVRSTRPVVPGCSSEYSQVPPARGCSPGASARSSRCDGVRRVRTVTRSMQGSDRGGGAGDDGVARPSAVRDHPAVPRRGRLGCGAARHGASSVGSVRGRNAREPVFPRRYGERRPRHDRTRCVDAARDVFDPPPKHSGVIVAAWTPPQRPPCRTPPPP